MNNKVDITNNIFSKKKLLILLIIIFLITPPAFLYYLKYMNVFPFITIEHIESIEEFNEIDNLSYELELSEYSENIINEYFSKMDMDNMSYENIIYEITLFVRENLQHQSNVIHKIAPILESEEPYPAICSGYSKLAVAISNTLGYPARVVWMWGHTVSEIYFADYGWVMVDTNGNVIFRNKQSNKFASIIDLTDNFDDYVPEKIISDEKFLEEDLSPDYLEEEDSINVFDDNEIIVVIDADNLMDFDIKSNNLVEIIGYLTGDDIAEGIQYVGKNKINYGNKRLVIWAFLSYETILFCLIVYLSIKIKSKRDNT